MKRDKKKLQFQLRFLTHKIQFSIGVRNINQSIIPSNILHLNTLL